MALTQPPRTLATGNNADGGQAALSDIGRPASQGAYAWYVVVVLAMIYMISVCDRAIMSIAVVPLKTSLALSDTQVALLAGAGFAILYCSATVPIGLLVDRLHRVRLIVTGLVIWTFATAGCAFAKSFEALFTARLFVGLGEAVVVPAAMSIIADYFTDNRLGRATAIFMAGSTIGSALAYLIGGLLLAMFAGMGGLIFVFHFEPWQALFLSAAIVSIPALALLILTVREPPRSSSSAAQASFREALGHIRKNRFAYVTLTITAATVWMMANILAAWVPSFFVRRFALPIQEVAAMTGTVSLIFAPTGAWMGGLFLDRLRARGVPAAPGIVAAISLALTGIFAVIMSQASSLPIALSAYAAAQMSAMAGGAPMMAGVQYLTPKPIMGITTALFLACVMLCSLAIGPTLVGILNDRLFSGEGLGDALSLSAIGVSTLGIIIALSSRSGFQRAIERRGDTPKALAI